MKKRVTLLAYHMPCSIELLFPDAGGDFIPEEQTALKRMAIKIQAAADFSILLQEYSSDRKTNKPLARLGEVGTEFDYQYDLGSTTELAGNSIFSKPWKLKAGIHLLACNSEPDILQCSFCKKYPRVICAVCDDFFCKKCKNKHRGCEGQEFLLPVVNSPRMGVCGYTGPD